MRAYDVILTNEGGDADCLYDVAAHSAGEAAAEAWRQYRECPTVDNEPPPAWACARVGEALSRKDGDKPYYQFVVPLRQQPKDRIVTNAEHCHPIGVQAATDALRDARTGAHGG